MVYNETIIKLMARAEKAEAEVVRLREALIAVAGEGPYYNDDGACAYCNKGVDEELYPELSSTFKFHRRDCAWVKATKAIANSTALSPARGEVKREGGKA